MKSAFPEKVHTNIYIFALIILVIGLPLSKFMMSVGELIMAGNWLLQGNLKNKFITFWKNKPALLLSSVLFLHFTGLINTSDFDYAFKDIRIKSPLFIIPIIICTTPSLSKKIYHLVLQFFIASIILTTFISTSILLGLTHRHVVDIRNISIFISHINFALLICIAIFICVYFFRNSFSNKLKLLWTAIISWLLIFLVLMGSVTGLSAIALVCSILMIYSIYRSNNKLLKIVGSLILVGSIVLFYAYINSIKSEIATKEIIDVAKLEKTTSHGHLYEYELKSQLSENGHLVWMHLCSDELKEIWNKRSKLDYNGLDLKGNVLRFTLIRFMSSKGIYKDGDALNTLTDNEIRAVERGVSNVNYQHLSSIRGRIHEILWEIDVYKKTGNPNGNSITQRFEHWKTAVSIIKQNLFFGVGTGDVQHAFDDEYKKTNSPLSKDLRFRSHNQYLTFTVAFGIIGLIVFLFSLVYPMMKQKMVFDFLYITFFIIAIFSFLTDDMLETQSGATFFAFFNAFFLFAREKEKVEN
jgi:hypothetical protein